ncbi:MAG: sugar phosphate nucleotidyltransferase [Acidimicrobiia bacterium]
MPGGLPTIILCGGRGTRISDVDPTLPKPMLPIGGRPVLWHVMSIYARHGHRDFVLALGWLGDRIRRWATEHQEPGWHVRCEDTGPKALTGTRVRLAAQAVGDGPVMVTYGDGVGDIDVTALVEFHRSHGRLATITAVHPPGRFGELLLAGDRVEQFVEKPQVSDGWINGGFMVLERDAIEGYIPDDDVMLEREPIAALADAGELMAYRHDGFWQPMDTPRERDLLEELWAAGDAPWMVQEDR